MTLRRPNERFPRLRTAGNSLDHGVENIEQEDGAVYRPRPCR